MRKSVALLLLCATPQVLAADWLIVAGDRLRSVEIDRQSILDSDAGTRVAWGRIVLSAEQAAKSGYTTVRTLNRYDCRNNAFEVVKRVYEDASGRPLREDEPARAVSTPVRPGTADERFFREVCPAARQHAALKAPPQSDTRALLALARQAERRAAAAVRKDDASASLRLVSSETPARQAPRSNPEAPVAKPRPAPAASKPHSVTANARAASARPEVSPPPEVARAWSYAGVSGPQAWAALAPANALCASGQRQSPIDLRDGIKVDQDPLGIDYKLSYFSIVDNGRSLRVGYGRGSWLSVMGRRYELLHADFHSPSETQVDGRSFDMSMQLFHRATDGRIAILEVLLQAGRANPLIQSLLNNLPLEAGQEYTAQNAIQLADALPAQRGYFAYMGSLSTPPCSEDVLRLVFKQPVELSAEQIAIFRRFHDHNVRPLQAANGRVVRESR